MTKLNRDFNRSRASLEVKEGTKYRDFSILVGRLKQHWDHYILTEDDTEIRNFLTTIELLIQPRQERTASESENSDDEEDIELSTEEVTLLSEIMKRVESALTNIEGASFVSKQKMLSDEHMYNDLAHVAVSSSFEDFVERLFDTLELRYFIDENGNVEIEKLTSLITGYVLETHEHLKPLQESIVDAITVVTAIQRSVVTTTQN